jgi:2-polyprenyl-6-methoxyphenol hydroxylase-like FAD-dependent oxidoreductase
MQGGCAALEDAIVLAQTLKGGWTRAQSGSSSSSSSSGGDGDLGVLLQQYESARAKRCLPLAVRSRGMGVILQSAWPPVVRARDTVLSKFLDPGHFFDHTLFDVGTL